MTFGDRYHYAGILRRAREEHTLVLAALGNAERCDTREVGRAIEMRRHELSDIALALEEVSAGSLEFGSCEICGGAIESFRLDVEPWTRRCGFHESPPRGH